MDILYNFSSIIPTHLYVKEFRELRYDYNSFASNNHEWVATVWIEYLNNKNETIAYISYNTTNGQIISLSVKREYQNRGIGKQILEKATNELREKNCEELWVVCGEHHPFWSNVNCLCVICNSHRLVDKKNTKTMVNRTTPLYYLTKSLTYRNPAHPSVTSDGYFRKL